MGNSLHFRAPRAFFLLIVLLLTRTAACFWSTNFCKIQHRAIIISHTLFQLLVFLKPWVAWMALTIMVFLARRRERLGVYSTIQAPLKSGSLSPSQSGFLSQIPRWNPVIVIQQVSPFLYPPISEFIFCFHSGYLLFSGAQLGDSHPCCHPLSSHDFSSFPGTLQLCNLLHMGVHN